MTETLSEKTYFVSLHKTIELEIKLVLCGIIFFDSYNNSNNLNGFLFVILFCHFLGEIFLFFILETRKIPQAFTRTPPFPLSNKNFERIEGHHNSPPKRAFWKNYFAKR